MLPMTESKPWRVVVDTNILVAGAYHRASASRRVFEAAERGELLLVVSPDIVREYDRIIPRAVRIPAERQRLRAVLAAGLRVHPQDNPSVTEDRTDDKFLSAAMAGSARAVITNDPHLLRVDGYRGIRVLRPSSFERFRSGAGLDGSRLGFDLDD